MGVDMKLAVTILHLHTCRSIHKLMVEKNMARIVPDYEKWIFSFWPSTLVKK